MKLILGVLAAFFMFLMVGCSSESDNVESKVLVNESRGEGAADERIRNYHEKRVREKLQRVLGSLDDNDKDKEDRAYKTFLNGVEVMGAFKAEKLGKLFIDNFAGFTDNEEGRSLVTSGPQLDGIK